MWLHGTIFPRSSGSAFLCGLHRLEDCSVTPKSWVDLARDLGSNKHLKTLMLRSSYLETFGDIACQWPNWRGCRKFLCCCHDYCSLVW